MHLFVIVFTMNTFYSVMIHDAELLIAVNYTVGLYA